MTKDLTAAVAVFPDDDGVGFDVLPAFFVPQERIKTRTMRTACRMTNGRGARC